MSFSRLQIHLQTHGNQSNATKHDQLTNKIALFSRQSLFCTLTVLYKMMKGVFSGQLLYDPFKTTSILEMSFNMDLFYSGSNQNFDFGQEQLNNMEERVKADNTKLATKWGLNRFEGWQAKRGISFHCKTASSKELELNDILRKFMQK